MPLYLDTYEKHWDQYSNAYVLKVLKSERLNKSPVVIIAILKVCHRSTGTFKLISNSVKSCRLPQVHKKVIGGLCGRNCGIPPLTPGSRCHIGQYYRYWTNRWTFKLHPHFRINITVLSMQFRINLYETLIFIERPKCSTNGMRYNFSGILPPFTYISNSKCLEVKIFILDDKCLENKFISTNQVLSKNVITKILKYESPFLDSVRHLYQKAKNARVSLENAQNKPYQFTDFIIIKKSHFLSYKIKCEKYCYVSMQLGSKISSINSANTKIFNGPATFSDMSFLQGGEYLQSSSFVVIVLQTCDITCKHRSLDYTCFKDRHRKLHHLSGNLTIPISFHSTVHCKQNKTSTCIFVYNFISKNENINVTIWNQFYTGYIDLDCTFGGISVYQKDGETTHNCQNINHSDNQSPMQIVSYNHTLTIVIYIFKEDLSERLLILNISIGSTPCLGVIYDFCVGVLRLDPTGRLHLMKESCIHPRVVSVRYSYSNSDYFAHDYF